MDHFSSDARVHFLRSKMTPDTFSARVILLHYTGIGSITRLLKWPTMNLILVANTTCDNIYKHKTYISWFLCLNHGILTKHSKE